MNIIYYIKHNLRNKARMVLATVFSLFFMASCGMIYDDYAEDEGTVAEELVFQISIGNRNFSTRAMDEAGEIGADDENYIDTDDMLILLLDKDDLVLCTLNAGAMTDKQYNTQEAAYNLKYSVINKGVNSVVANKEPLNVMVLANWNSYDPTLNLPQIGANLNYDIRELLKTIFYNTQVGDQVGEGNLSWKPDQKADKLMPMYGYASNLDYTYTSIDAKVSMQHALARIQIYDNLFNVKDDEDHTSIEITDVELSSYNTKGRPAPDKGNYEHATSVSSLDNQNILKSTGTLKFHKIPVAASGNTPAYNKWVAYVPEMSLGNDLNDPKRPYFIIHYRDKNGGENGAAIEGEARVEFAKYNPNGSLTTYDNDHPSLWTSFLRNHVYTFNIISITKIASWVDTEFEGHFLRFGLGYWFLYDESSDTYWYYDMEHDGELRQITISKKDNKEWWYIFREEENNQTYIFYEDDWAKINVEPGTGKGGEDTWTVEYKVTGNPKTIQDLYFRYRIEDDETSERILCFDIDETRYLAPDNKEVNISWTYVYDHGFWIKTFMTSDETDD